MHIARGIGRGLGGIEAPTASMRTSLELTRTARAGRMDEIGRTVAALDAAVAIAAATPPLS
ncbi:hypothetical protein ACKI2N_014555 [Cupriavidus sp. 30B13]|uniref:hypothetical protein n=1 Tax=Cupriavidus sp. 30B13 TaxID=3384241 RepID=UPI003B912668